MNSRTYLITDDDYYLTPCAVVTCTWEQATALVNRLGEPYRMVEVETVSSDASLEDVENAAAKTTLVRLGRGRA